MGEEEVTKKITTKKDRKELGILMNEKELSHVVWLILFNVCFCELYDPSFYRKGMMISKHTIQKFLKN